MERNALTAIAPQTLMLSPKLALRRNLLVVVVALHVVLILVLPEFLVLATASMNMAHASMVMNAASSMEMVTSAISLASLPRRPRFATPSRTPEIANMELIADSLTTPPIAPIKQHSALRLAVSR